ncbi:nickel pincer cofactor biosynthesis protein LarC [bacterium]|nr:nickel pincer cofactor biosynthesis protein LarC [bacterium]
MKIAQLNCFSGVSGNMLLGALINAGLEQAALERELAKLNLVGFSLSVERVRRGSIAGTLVNVLCEEQHAHRHLNDIEAIINSSALSSTVKERAVAVFRRLAAAEAQVHGTSIDEVHFHEVGALDAIVDIVGTVAGLELLGVERLYSSPLSLGTGTVDCAHGRLPVPAPATLELLKGVPIRQTAIEAELVTPTGAALVTTLAEGFNPPPSMRVEAIGYGAGSRELASPNLLRLTLGETQQAPTLHDEVVLLETDLDDATGEELAHTAERLRELGVLDVSLLSLQMKKGRPGVRLSVLVQPELADAAEETIFRQTGSFGLRRQTIGRTILERSFETIKTKYGSVKVKVGRHRGVVVSVVPEYEDCRKLAVEHGLSLPRFLAEVKVQAAEQIT